MYEILAQQCAQVAVPEPTELALRYYHSGNILWIVSQAWSLILPLLFLFTGFSGWLNKVSDMWGRKWFFSLVIYLALFIFFSQLLNLPLEYYSGYVREHAYGLSTQSFGRWAGNYGKSTLVAFVASAAFVWIFYLLLKKSPRRWWFYSSLASIALIFFSIFIQPIWIDPLFHNFGPMKDKQLEQQILHLASRSGIEGARVYEVDMSQDTTALNAYVTGFGSTKRIVLWDTTLQKLTPDEILFVMGHEMGHYVLHHIWWYIGLTSLLTFAIFYLTYRSAHFFLRRWHNRFGFQHLYDFASFPLLLLLLTFYQLLFTPVMNMISRYYEHEADRFGLEITQNNEAAAKAFIVLQQQNLGVPYPGMLYVIWRGSHPPLGERIDFSNSYCPWKAGATMRYADRFKD